MGTQDSVSTIALFIKEVGIPALLLLWFMTRMEKRIDHQSELLANLLTAVTVLAKSVDWRNREEEKR